MYFNNLAKLSIILYRLDDNHDSKISFQTYINLREIHVIRKNVTKHFEQIENTELYKYKFSAKALLYNSRFNF